YSTILFCLAIGIASYFGIWLYRSWSGRRQLLDIPNERSSHKTPVSRGAGVVVVLLTLFSYLVLGIVRPQLFFPGFPLAVGLIALVGWLDDVYSVSFGWRLLVQFSAAGIFIFDVGYFGSRESATTFAAIFLILLTGGWLVWMTNAFNFMDGIDGIAGLQAVVAAAGWAVFASINGIESVLLLSGVIGAACVGFLIHNWQPARVFMGDVCSTFLGFAFAAMPLIASRETGLYDWSYLFAGIAFVWFFLFDTVFTLLRRLFKFRRVWRPHREHLYQKLLISGLQHRTVSLIYGSLSSFAAAAILFNAPARQIYAYLVAGFVVFLTFALLVFVAVRNRLT
ncbi:MAG: glycosyltransferase family 4 protein, partial [Acidobacteria bacterium]|nr:glycosyltransferase family 4 protein [Acidobacteriota bacterium]